MKSRRIAGCTVARHEPRFRSAAISAAVSLAVAGPAAAEDWKPTIESFVRQGSGRTLGGVDAVLPFRQGGTSLFFADLRAHAANRDANEFNLGLGYRGLTAGGEWALGGYAAWDRRRSPLGNDFMQVTLGAEARSDRFDLRTNLYRPVTDKKPVGLGGANRFSGFGVYRNTVFEEAMGGYDVEAGFRLPLESLGETRVFLAGYSFRGKDVAPHADGGRIRFEIRPIQSLAIGLSRQHDKAFGTRNSFELRYTFDRPARREARSLRDRMSEPWTRDIDVVVSQPTESIRPAEAVATSDRVVHVDNSKAAGGDGSFEHPYASVEACLAGKCSDAGYGMVRLWQGNSTTTPYSPIRLQDGQTLWGQGYDIFSGVSSPGLRPVLDAKDYWPTAVVSLASDAVRGNTVAGVKINPGLPDWSQASQAAYLVGAAPLEFGSAWHGIVGYNTGGTVRIVGNEISNGGFAGILLYNSGRDIQQRVEIFGNAIRQTAYGSGVELTNESRSSLIRQHVALGGNSIVSAVDGIYLSNSAVTGGQSTQTVDIQGNAIQSGSSGLNIQNATPARYSFDEASPPYYAILVEPADGLATQTVNVASNIIAAQGTAVNFSNFADPGGGSSQMVTFSGNRVTSAQGNGLIAGNFSGLLSAGGNASQSLLLKDNSIDVSERRGVAIMNAGAGAGAGAGTQTVVLDGNTITTGGIGQYGVTATNFASGGSQTQSVVLTNNSVRADRGVMLGNSATDGGFATETVRVSGNTIESSVYGVLASNSGTAAQAVQSGELDNNIVSGGAVAIRADHNNVSGGSSAQTLTIAENALSASQYGVANCAHGSAGQRVNFGANTLEGGAAPFGTDYCPPGP